MAGQGSWNTDFLVLAGSAVSTIPTYHHIESFYIRNCRIQPNRPVKHLKSLPGTLTHRHMRHSGTVHATENTLIGNRTQTRDQDSGSGIVNHF